MVNDFLHVGISVRNLEESVRFYTEVLGMQEDTRAYHTGEKVSRVVDVENAEVAVCYVTKGKHRLELIEYKNKDQAKLNYSYKPQDEPGLVHIAFIVEDVDESYQKIKNLGYQFNSPPMVTRENGPKIAFFKGPDNVIVELYQKAGS
ncbi:MAG: VOC family protein [Desulfobacterales bacterium]|nr:MAG: VOC family protein [Desulfobacterales bacterium]